MEEEKLVELSDQEVCIDFTLNCKCRANVRLKSLSTTNPIAFKVQTSSPHKFLVNPPTGLIPPLSYATFQIILKPQPELPSSFPRSPTDRFLIKTILVTKITNSADSINSLFTHHQLTTYDLRLKVAYIGLFLLRHAVATGDVHAVRNLIKRQKLLAENDVEPLIRIATESSNSEKMIQLLKQASPVSDDARADVKDRNSEILPPQLTAQEGDSILTAARRGEVRNVELLLKKGAASLLNEKDQYGLTSLHAAAIKGHKDVVSLLIKFGIDIECLDKEGHTALHLAVEGGNMETVELLVNKGANVNAMSQRGSTPLYLARAMGSDDISKFLSDRGAYCASQPSSSSFSLSSVQSIKQG